MSNRLVVTLVIVAAIIAALTLHDASQIPAPAPAIAPVPAQEVPVPPAEANALPPLPEVALRDAPVHAPPEDTASAGDRKSDGTLREQNVSDEVANGPRHLSSLPPPPKQFSGSAAVTGPIMLQIGIAKVSLFGVKPALATDHCAADAKRNCADAARQTLQNDSTGIVSCHAPNPSLVPGVSYAICLNASGIDLGGVLVSEGLALADTGQSYDYVGAEGVARSQKRGLWGSR